MRAPRNFNIQDTALDRPTFYIRSPWPATDHPAGSSPLRRTGGCGTEGMPEQPRSRTVLENAAASRYPAPTLSKRNTGPAEGRWCAPRKGAEDQWMKVPPEQLSVQFGSYPDEGRGNPTARSSGDKGRPWADRAKLRAATRSESRAGSESTVVTPTRHHRGEGRRIAGKATDARTRNGHRGIGSGTQGRLSEATREARNDGGLRPATLSVGPRSERASERPIVLAKPGNAGGGKGPHFRVLLRKTRARRLAR